MPSSRALTEYGDKDNSDLSERFKIGTDDFSQYRLWTKGKDSTAEPVKFSGAKKSEEFMKFIQSNAGVWVGLPGQVKELDSLAKEFGSAKDKASIIAKAGKLKLDEKDAESAKYYTKARRRPPPAAAASRTVAPCAPSGAPAHTRARSFGLAGDDQGREGRRVRQEGGVAPDEDDGRRLGQGRQEVAVRPPPEYALVVRVDCPARGRRRSREPTSRSAGVRGPAASLSVAQNVLSVPGTV